MTRVIIVDPSARPATPPHLALVSCGYESRARFCAIRNESAWSSASKRLAYGWRNQKMFAYEDNRATLSSLGYQVEDVSCDEFEHNFREHLADITRKVDGTLSAKVDISSMTRRRIAAVFGGCSDIAAEAKAVVEVEFLYAPAAFLPNREESSVISLSGPVHSRYEGSLAGHQRWAALIGLGEEGARALGVWEFFSPETTAVWIPRGTDQRYDDAGDRCNHDLLQVLGPECTRIHYAVNRPSECVSLLVSSARGLSRNHRVVAVPLGPKIFALCAIAAAEIMLPRMTVWRVTSGDFETPVDHKPMGPIISLHVHFDGR